jgi:hypothetical protein
MSKRLMAIIASLSPFRGKSAFRIDWATKREQSYVCST